MMASSSSATLDRVWYHLPVKRTTFTDMLFNSPAKMIIDLFLPRQQQGKHETFYSCNYQTSTEGKRGYMIIEADHHPKHVPRHGRRYSAHHFQSYQQYA